MFLGTGLKRGSHDSEAGLPHAGSCQSGAGDRINGLLHCGAQPGLLIGARVAMQHADLHSLVDLAEGGVHAGLDRLLGIVPGLLGIGGAGHQATLHQRAEGRLVGPVAEAVALSDQNTLLRRLVIGHRRTDAGSANDNPSAMALPFLGSASAARHLG